MATDPLIFERVRAAGTGGKAIPEIDVRDTERWLSNILAAPEDDAPRLVYADWLLEQGEPLGELIQLQCRGAQAQTTALRDREQALLEAHRERWLGTLRQVLTGAEWHRGFVTRVSARTATFAKYAVRIFERFPLLEGFRFDAVMAVAEIRALGACPLFTRFRALDTGPEHSFARLAHVQTLLDSPYFPAQLRWLRLGPHGAGRGFGLDLVECLLDSGKLTGLEHLEISGQMLGQTFRGEHRGTRALVRLLKGLPTLRVLRVPYNGFLVADADTMATHLAEGLAPALEALDFGDDADTLRVTKAVEAQRNRVFHEGQGTVDAALAARRGQLRPAPPRPIARALPQLGRFPFVELARSGRATCVVCRKVIAAGTRRLGIEREQPEVGRFTAWVHPACRGRCPELIELAALLDVDERLTENSGGFWPP